MQLNQNTIIMKRLLLSLSMALFSLSLFAQVTTGAMNGQVVDGDGVPLIGAAVVATHLPTGSIYGNTTNVD